MRREVLGGVHAVRPFFPRPWVWRSSALQQLSHRQCSSSTQEPPTKQLVTGVALVGLTGVGAWLWSEWGKKTKINPLDLPVISDDIFDRSDNFVVFFLDHVDELNVCAERMRKVMNELSNEVELKGLKFYYNLFSGTPGEETVKPELDPNKSIKVILYKGQRKAQKYLEDPLQTQEFIDFFAPVSEDLDQEKKELLVPLVSGNDFRQHVMEASSADHPVLLQMYEDTCFLCFLMRPFINSLAKICQDQKIPFAIKRLNLERNDFPPGCPVARGTPTFVLFRGKNVEPWKWDEFKPKDVVDRLEKEMPNYIKGEVLANMQRLENSVSKRFQLFTQLVMWSVELGKLENLLVKNIGDQDDEDGDEGNEVEFNTSVQELMSTDMQRTDLLDENLELLQTEVNSAEIDLTLLGSMLAQKVLDAEKLEATKFAKQKRG
eukprot:gnl/MRDRNA2_/MRDRNA2_95192_c0_seq1.p1 gnl/MRDRNA2_/MRDRNA2_95192_c0~~gnl/MRDRNA2_/MRDRNA2_95192_c0_seq1.p1  ORF type:complete len:433 (+),score=96.39 gnl/MRDRNA2_/MRDRNA2_95192_c0_seq1:35-1333(+)